MIHLCKMRGLRLICYVDGQVVWERLLTRTEAHTLIADLNKGLEEDGR